MNNLPKNKRELAIMLAKVRADTYRCAAASIRVPWPERTTKEMADRLESYAAAREETASFIERYTGCGLQNVIDAELRHLLPSSK